MRFQGIVIGEGQKDSGKTLTHSRTDIVNAKSSSRKQTLDVPSPLKFKFRPFKFRCNEGLIFNTLNSQCDYRSNVLECDKVVVADAITAAPSGQGKERRKKASLVLGGFPACSPRKHTKESSKTNKEHNIHKLKNGKMSGPSR